MASTIDEAEYLLALQRRKRFQQPGPNSMSSEQPATYQQNGRPSSKPVFRPQLFPGGNSKDRELSFAYDGPASQFDRSNPDLNALDLNDPDPSGAAPPALMHVLHDTLADDGVDESERRRRNRQRRRSSDDEDSAKKQNEQSPDARNGNGFGDDIETVDSSGYGIKLGNGRGMNAWKLNPDNPDYSQNTENVSNAASQRPLTDADGQDAAPVGDIVAEKEKKRRKKKKKRTNEAAEDADSEENQEEKPFDKPTKILAAPSDPYDALDLSDLRAFALRPAPKGVTIKCRVTRDKKGIDRGVYPVYFLHLEHNEYRRTFLLAARRRKKSKTSNYAFSIDPIDLARDGDAFIGKLRANFVGSQFSLYYFNCATETKAHSRELAAVCYDTNILGFKGPRKMTVVVPGMNEDDERVDASSEGASLLDRIKQNKTSGLVELHNKTPVWNDETQSYVLNFHGRVTQPSVKNFQIVHNNDVDYIVMQFGRVADDTFNLDFSFPLSALQAFGIAISSFDGKLACE